MIALETPFAAALNHLLEAEPRALERLAPHAGAALELRAPPLPALRLSIDETGRLAPAAPDAEISLIVRLGPEALPALARGEDHFMRAVEVTGNASLANEVVFLFRNLRWDMEEDLSRLVGDVIAHRMAGAARDFLAWQKEAGLRVAESLIAYAAEEKKLLVRRAELERFARAAAGLRDALARLEKRIERLGG